jgi:hypothetical protein
MYLDILGQTLLLLLLLQLELLQLIQQDVGLRAVACAPRNTDVGTVQLYSKTEPKKYFFLMVDCEYIVYFYIYRF